MRSIALITGVIILVITIFLVLVFASIFGTFLPGEVDTSIEPSPSIIMGDYSSYIVDENPIDPNTYDECARLKNAIKYAILNDKPYKIDEIAYGNDLYSLIALPFIGDCPSEEILINIGSGLSQKTCTFRTININEVQGDGAAGNPYGGISDALNLSFDICSYGNADSSFLLVAGNSGPFPENVNSIVTTTNLFYSPDYFYQRNGDYVHYPSLNNNNAFNNVYNGPGRLKMYVGNATYKNNTPLTGGDCRFNVYFCPRPAIALSKENATIKIFDLFKNLELYNFRHLGLIPDHIRDHTDLALDMPGYDKGLYHWNYYDVPLDGEYRVETIINAIKEGLYLGVEAKNYFWAHPHWNIERDTGISKVGECWNPAYETLLVSADPNDRTRSIRFNCDDDNMCNGDLRIKIAIRHDNITQDIDGDGEGENLNYISGVITFCSSLTPVASFLESASVVSVGTVITFDASGSYDPDGNIVSYEWDFGDGSTATGITTSHAYSATGTYTVTLNVTDSDGLSKIATATKRVYLCGNGVREFGEVCDDGNTINCNPYPGCSADCSRRQYCGDGTPECTDVCDDGNNINCDSYPGGCRGDCSRIEQCGDDIVECGEQCDGSNLNGQTCLSQGYVGGVLGCTGSCTFDYSSCICADKCESGLEYRNGIGDPCVYSTIRECRYGCSGDNLNCIPGEWCPSVTCTGTDGLLCGGYTGSCTVSEQCIKSGDPAPSCPYGDYRNSNDVLLNCWLFSCQSQGYPASAWCNGIPFLFYCCTTPLDCTATCTVDTSCTYECYDTGGSLNQQGTCTDGGACINGCDDFCVGNNKVGYGCILDICSVLVGIACPAPTTCVNGACV